MKWTRRKRSGQTTESWLWQNVNKTETCWNWLRPPNASGYGRIELGTKWDGEKNKTKKCWQFVHRFVWELTYGPIPDMMCVCHKCDNPKCCRPDHLFLGTNQENMNDRNQKRRHAHGVRHASAKLDEEKVREARRMYATGDWNYMRLGAHFGVADTVMHKAVTGRTWGHVT